MYLRIYITLNHNWSETLGCFLQFSSNSLSSIDYHIGVNSYSKISDKSVIEWLTCIVTRGDKYGVHFGENVTAPVLIEMETALNVYLLHWKLTLHGVCCRQKQQMLSKWWCICSAVKKKLRLKNIYTLCGVWLRVCLSLSLGFGGWLNDWDDDDVGRIQRPTLISWIIQKIDRSSERFLDS